MKEKQFLSHMPEEDHFIDAADNFAKLGDASRLRIFWILCHGEENVTDICEIMGMSAPAVSHHLRILKDSGLVASRKSGRTVNYRLADTAEAELLHEALDAMFDITCPNLI